MTEATKQMIQREAEALFPMADHLEKGMTGYRRTMDNRKIYTKGATSEHIRAEKLVEALNHIIDQLEELGEDYDPGNTIFYIQSKIAEALNNFTDQK